MGVFFLRQILTYELAILTEFFKIICRSELKFETNTSTGIFFVTLWGFRGRHFGQFGTNNARYI